MNVSTATRYALSFALISTSAHGRNVYINIYIIWIFICFVQYDNNEKLVVTWNEDSCAFCCERQWLTGKRVITRKVVGIHCGLRLLIDKTGNRWFSNIPYFCFQKSFDAPIAAFAVLGIRMECAWREVTFVYATRTCGKNFLRSSERNLGLVKLSYGNLFVFLLLFLIAAFPD